MDFERISSPSNGDGVVRPEIGFWPDNIKNIMVTRREILFRKCIIYLNIEN